MEQWIERFKQHNIHTNLDVYIQEIQNANTANTSPSLNADIARLKSCLDYIKRCLDSAAYHLISKNILDTIDLQIMNSRQQFEAFLRAKNRGHIEEANRIIEHAIISSKTLPSIADGSKDETPLQGLLVKMQEEFMRIHRNHDAQNNYFNSMISNFKREIEQAQQALGDLKDTIKEEKKNVSQMASDQQRQFGAAQEGRLKEFSEYMKETNIMADIKMDLLNADIKKKITAVEADLHQMQKEVKQNFDAIIEQISHEAKNLSQDLKNKDIQANRLLESVGTERLPPERR